MERATFKIEIPFTDHAHCIGRQGNQIQSIMLATDTHIHFPDSNREPNGTKSNQVSISGTIPSIEQARKRIRDILPMSLKFPIPSRESSNITNDDYPLFKYVRLRYGVMVLPRSYTKTGDLYCIVRGLINQPELAEATEYLLQAFYGFESSSIKVTCQTEVSEQYHGYLQTRQQSRDMCITAVEQYTHAKIQFPTTTPNSNGFGRRTSIIITGSPAQVCQARKLFDLCLPIVLTFEMPNDKELTRADTVHIKDKFNVTTAIRARRDKIGKLASLQSQEYNSEQLFRARAMILGLAEANDSSTQTSSVDLNSSSTLLSENSIRVMSTCHPSDDILTQSELYAAALKQQTDSLLAPSNKPNTTKKPSPIGHERSTLRNVDQDAMIWPSVNDRLSSSPIFDTSERQMKAKSNSMATLRYPNDHSTKLFSLLRSVHLEKYYSTFEHNQNLLSSRFINIDDYGNLITHSTTLDINTPLSFSIDDVNANLVYLPPCSLLSI